VAWGRAIGISAPKAERAAVAELPQHLADMFGWPELVDSVARARDLLPESERARTVIIAGNYGEAAAIDWLGSARGLPPAHSTHNAYFTWGPPRDATAPVLVVGSVARRDSDIRAVFHEVKRVGQTQCRLCMPFERETPIYLCRGWRRAPSAVWPESKRYF
jgi:hypothetical protein